MRLKGVVPPALELFFKDYKMPVCPKCCNELIKRKSDNTYNCKRHGWVRDITTPPPSHSMEELSELIKSECRGTGPVIHPYNSQKMVARGLLTNEIQAATK